jgi:dTDP-4-dehydrorhamnose reductase
MAGSRFRTPESATPAPLSAYGRSKTQAEARVRTALNSALIVRTSALFGPWGGEDFVSLALRMLAAGQILPAPDDLVVSPTYVPDLVHATLDLLIDGEAGIWHLANRGATTWLDLTREAARRTGIDDTTLERCSVESLGLSAARPPYSVLDSERAWLLSSLDDALGRYSLERKAHAEDVFATRHQEAAAALPLLLRRVHSRGVA